MDAFINFLIEWGYLGMFLSAVLAGSVVPFSSEAVLAALVLPSTGLSPVICLLSASAGNLLGSLTCYAMGRMGRMDWLEKYFHMKGRTYASLPQRTKRLHGFLRFSSHYRKRNSRCTGISAKQYMGSFHLYAGRKNAALYISNPCSEGADRLNGMKRIIELTADGSATLFVPELNEHYHSVKGARTESQHIFIDMGLNASEAVEPHILEIGFGTGFNALLTLETAERSLRKVHYTGIELYPLSWDIVEPLGYSNNPLFKTLHMIPWGEDAIITPHFTLRKVQADVNNVFMCPCGNLSAENTVIPDSNRGIGTATHWDIIYFDAFAPEKQPEMWSQELFNRLYVIMNPKGILTTYCAKGIVRRMLQAAGFTVERLPGPPGGKREILRARKDCPPEKK